MNNNVLVIEDAGTSIAKFYGYQSLAYGNQQKDEQIHAWLLYHKDKFANVDKIAISCRLGKEDADLMGLYIGLHIRLTLQLEEARFLPLVFLTEATREDLLMNQIAKGKLKSALLLFTKGAYLISVMEMAPLLSKTLPKLSNIQLLDDVLPHLQIASSTDTGHHLANEWGAFRLAKAAGYTLQTQEPVSLFFKYKNTSTNNEVIVHPRGKIADSKESCKALLIDDNANKGWQQILTNIIQDTATIENKQEAKLDIFDSYEQGINFNGYEQYDIIFLDLRLLPKEDNPNLIQDIEAFSGARILKKIKAINRGIQVIILTASNKIWNIERLMKLGANGYYIKESPEYIQSNSFSEENYREFFKKIQLCLQRKALREIFDLSKQSQQGITILLSNNKILQDDSHKLLNYIQLSDKAVEQAESDQEYSMAYLSLYRCIELLSEIYVGTENPWLIFKRDPLKKYQLNKATSVYTLTSDIYGRKETPGVRGKLIGLALQKLNLSNTEICRISNNVNRRNETIHPSEKPTTPAEEAEIQKVYTITGYLQLTVTLQALIKELKQVPLTEFANI